MDYVSVGSGYPIGMRLNCPWKLLEHDLERQSNPCFILCFLCVVKTEALLRIPFYGCEAKSNLFLFLNFPFLTFFFKFLILFSMEGHFVHCPPLSYLHGYAPGFIPVHIMQLHLFRYPQHGIKHKAAIIVCKQCLLLVIAALCFTQCCGLINKYGP